MSVKYSKYSKYSKIYSTTPTGRDQYSNQATGRMIQKMWFNSKQKTMNKLLLQEHPLTSRKQSDFNLSHHCLKPVLCLKEHTAVLSDLITDFNYVTKA